MDWDAGMTFGHSTGIIVNSWTLENIHVDGKCPYTGPLREETGPEAKVIGALCPNKIFI